MENSSSPSPSSSSQSMGVPIAIVLAGGLVALAIYFGGSAVPTTNSGVGVNLNNEVADQGANGVNELPPAPGEAREVDETDHVRGATDPKVTIIEYSDFECPFCRRFHPTMEQIIEEYPNDVAWVYRHFPLESIHPNARIAANASECAAEQDAFWEFTDYIFANTSSGSDIAESRLPSLAESAGVPNLTDFNNCLEERKFDDKVEADLTDAQTAGGRGTPYSIVIGPDGEQQALSGALPYEAVKEAVDNLLQS